jgi:hypothetical protein
VGVEWILVGDYAAVYGLEDIRSCAPLSNGELAGLIRGFPGMKSLPNWETDLTNPFAAHALLNFLNVKYVLTPPSVILQEGLGFRVAERSDLGVVENLEVWPRAFFSRAIVSIPSAEEFVKYLLQNGKQPFVALTPEEIAKHPVLAQLPGNSTSSATPATNYQLLPNSTGFDIHADSAGVVCLSEAQADDFIAAVNGESKTVLTVNRAFKGVYLEKPGDYHIVFTYRPRHWAVACALFWAAAGLAVVLASASFYAGKFKKVVVLPNPDIPMP